MQKLKIKKDVYEQVASKLGNLKNGENKGNLGEISAISDTDSKLQASEDDEFREEYDQGFIEGLKNKNVFQRGDFDDWKISDEELKKNYVLEKSVDTNKCTLEMTTDCNGNIIHRWMKIADEEILKQKQLFSDAIESFIKNNYTQSTSITVLQHIPKILIDYANMADIPLQVTSKVLRKILLIPDSAKSHKHNISKAILKDLPVQLNKPIGIYKQKDNGHIIVLTEHVIGKNPIICAIELNKTVAVKNKIEIKINSLRSLHDKHDFNFFIALYENKEKLYEDKKKMDTLQAFLQYGGVNSVTIPSKSNISNLNNLSIKKSLTYSGHKLQSRTRLYGMNISIENKKGSYRSGTDKDGHKWRTYMNYDYGYIRETVGVDGDHVDCYIGPDKESEKVYVIHQNDPVTKKYDEDKCMLCFESADAAKKAYMKQYDRPGFFGSMEVLTIEQFKSYVFSHLGKRIHKSFDIKVTDITENNKQQKVEQVQKSLIAIAGNKPFIIKHIPADNSKHYGDITLRITDFDRSKIEKAVHKMAFSLDTDIPAKGEAFNYKSQEELTNRIVKEFTQKTNAVYQFVIDYFDLPEIRIVSKSKLRYKGKVIYNPETGKPIEKKDWKKFVQALEDFLNRNYSGMGEKIVLSAESLGRILERMSKNTSMAELKKKTLDELEVNHRKFDWISNTATNMKDTFGETVTRERASRIQSAIDSAAQRITKVSDNMRNDIQQIIIDGIKDRQSKSQISQNLFDKCVGLNRDFQKIADTEIQNNANNAYLKEEVYHTKEGEKVYFKRFEILDDNTCKKCKEIKGEVALWSDTPLPDENINDPYAKYAIWEYKMSGKLPVSVMHPFCRGSWFRYYPELE